MRPIIENKQPPALNKLEFLIFFSRWLQAPLYFGLIVVQLVYVYKFGIELLHLAGSLPTLKESEVLLIVLGLVDAVMVANLLFMVTVGGYETFVSRLYLETHPDQPEWLHHVDAGVLKIKLGAALITISSVHLLKTFIDAANIPMQSVITQVVIHCVFLVSLGALTWSDKLMKQTS